MIKAIVFDFGRVISAQKPMSLFRGYEKELGIEPGTLNPIMFGSPAWEDTLLGRKTASEFWHTIGPQLNLHTPEAIDAFRQRYHADEAINAEVVALIRHLRAAGHYKLAVLSNAPPGLAHWLDEWGLLELFDVVFCSGDEGVKKPDPAAFAITLQRLGVAPEEAVFIDDYHVHVAAARQVGLHATRFRGLPFLRRRLEGLGIPVPGPVLVPVPDVRAIVFDWGGVMEALPNGAYIADWERRLALAPHTLPAALWWGDAWRQLSVGAITNEGHNKVLCSKYVRMTRHYVRKHYGFNGYGCGFCQTNVPCESGIPEEINSPL